MASRAERYEFRPSISPGCVDIFHPAASTHYGEGIADRFALYEGDSWEDGAREYCQDSGWAVVEVRADGLVAETRR